MSAHLHAQARDAGIQPGDVALATEGQHQLLGVVVGDDVLEVFGICDRLLAARCLQVELQDQRAEDDVVDQRKDRPQDQDDPGFDVVDPVQRIVDEAVAEAVAEPSVEQVGDQIGDADQDRMGRVQQGRDEQEGEFQRLGDAGQERGQRRGAHDAGHARLVLRLGRVIDGQRRRGQAEHLEHEAAAEDGRLVVAGEEAAEHTVHGLAGIRVDVGADLEEEGHVPDVMQAEGQQHALDDAVDGHRRGWVAVGGPVAEGADGAADGRPDHRQDRRQPDGRERDDDRHEALAGEEAEIGRQLDAVIAVE